MSTYKTTNLNMNSWTGTDLFRLDELNENFNKVDTKVGSIDAVMAQKVNRSELVSNDAKFSKIEADLAIINSSTINARNYGAKGDGTTDDTAAIQAALNALTANGSFVLPPGKYSVKNLVIPDVFNITLYFHGELVARAGGDTDYVLATAKYVNNTPEAGLPIKLMVTPKINGNNIAVNGLVIQTWDTTIESPDVQGCQNGIKITGETRNGTAFTSSTLVNNVINNPRLHNNTQRGLWLRDPSRNKVTDFHMYGGYVLLNGVNGIDLESSAGCLIHGTHTYGNGRAMRIAIGSLGLRVNDCYMEEEECISIDDCNADTLVNLRGNTFMGRVRIYSYNVNAGIASSENTFRTANGYYVLIWSDAYVLSKGDSFQVANPYVAAGGDGTANSSAPNKAYASKCTSTALGANVYIEGVQEKNYTQTVNPVVQLTAAPTTGTWKRGDIVQNASPSNGGFLGWVCVTAGAPGAWQPYGAIGESSGGGGGGGGGSHFIDVKEFGAVGDGTTNDTGAIQQALDAAELAGGGTVFLPVGVYRVTNIKVGAYTVLQGAGIVASKISLADNATSRAVIELKYNAAAPGAIVDLQIDGRKANQVNAVDGIFIDNQWGQGDNLWEGDAYNRVENVLITNCSRNGLSLARSQENRIRNVVARDNNGVGIYVDDKNNYLTNCTASNNGLHGFQTAFALKFSNCKAFGNGKINSDTSGDGFYIMYTNNVQLVNCEAQSNGRHGFHFENCKGITANSVMSDSNHALSTSRAYAYRFVNCSHVQLSGIASNSEASAGRAGNVYGLSVQSSTQLDVNLIVVSHRAESPIVPFEPDMFLLQSNNIVINGKSVFTRNTFPNPTMQIDTNADGIADGFERYTNAGITSTQSIDKINGAQKVTITAAPNAWGRVGLYERTPIAVGETVQASLLGRVDNADLNIRLSIEFYTSGNVLISSHPSGFAGSGTNGWGEVNTIATAPATAAFVRVEVQIGNSVVGALGNALFKDLYIMRSV